MHIVVAHDKKRGIAKNGQMPWRIIEDLSWFSKLTRDSTIIMGRKTWLSLPRKPLSLRTNIVLSNTQQNFEGAIVCNSLQQALRTSFWPSYVIGGVQLYQEALKHPDLEYVFVTEIDYDFECDQFFPEYDHLNLQTELDPVDSKSGYRFQVKIYSTSS